MTSGIAYAAKAITAATAVLTSVAALNLLPEQYARYVSGALAILGVLSVYLVPNRKPAPTSSSVGSIVAHLKLDGATVAAATLPPLTEPPADLEDPA